MCRSPRPTNRFGPRAAARRATARRLRARRGGLRPRRIRLMAGRVATSESASGVAWVGRRTAPGSSTHGRRPVGRSGHRGFGSLLEPGGRVSLIVWGCGGCGARERRRDGHGREGRRLCAHSENRHHRGGDPRTRISAQVAIESRARFRPAEGMGNFAKLIDGGRADSWQ
jgi:hypothetical protein